MPNARLGAQNCAGTGVQSRAKVGFGLFIGGVCGKDWFHSDSTGELCKSELKVRAVNGEVPDSNPS